MIGKCYVIPVQNKCNANCIFCISKSRLYNKQIEMLECDDKFIENMFLLKKRGIKKFEITGGGEPFLNPNLELIITTIKKIIPSSYIKVYTNGNILKEIGNIDELNISVVHDDKFINNRYMKDNSNLSLDEKIRYFRKIYPNIKLRLSIPLIKGAIDDIPKLKKFIEQFDEYIIDEYVVRTLYPNTPYLKDLYIDFDYYHQRLIFEKKNDVSIFDGLILWSDNIFYNSWSLTDKRYLYTYLLLKPDSRTYINEIDDLITQNGFNILKKYYVEKFNSLAVNFYRDKSDENLQKVIKHLDNTSFLFGNQGLIFILDKNCSIEALIKETNDLKNQIRDMYSFTYNRGGVITIFNDSSRLNLVHTPDLNLSAFDNDLDYIKNNFKREINEEEYSLIKKYRSYNI